LKENNNVKTNEEKLKKLLNDLEKLFTNSSSGLVVNTSRSIPVNSENNRKLNTSQANPQITKFVNGKNYKKVTNTSALKEGNTLLWKSEENRPMKGNINKINKVKGEVTIKKSYFQYSQNPSNKQKQTITSRSFFPYTIKFNKFNEKNVKVQVKNS
jgi:hypothetical protein